MKKIILLGAIVFNAMVMFGQKNDLGAEEEFYSLLSQMGRELPMGETITGSDILENMKVKIDDQLAYKYLWKKNQFMKPGEIACYPAGYILNRENDIAIIFFVKGETDNLALFLETQTYNYKTGKFINQLPAVAGFSKENGSDCTMKVVSPNLILFKTFTLLGNTDIVLKVNNRGKIDMNP